MKIIKYTKVGEFHKRNSKKNEDVIKYRENDRFVIITLSDGVTSCGKSREGAAINCAEAIKFLMKNAQGLYPLSDEKKAYLILEQLIYKLQLAAIKENAPLSDYAATLSFCCFDKKYNKLLLFNSGDGAIFEHNCDSKKTQLVLKPQRYDEVYTPLVTTENAYKAAEIKILDAKKNHIIFICSDGVLKEFNEKLDENVSIDLSEDCYELKNKLKNANNFDDCSFIALKI
ncbi:MAG: protein phosphatase 2C domain-containing protein [Eubacterium sp.]|nr:protein phosphatase 2C domain-containing protein [Eubacterium sp.]